MAHAHSHTDDHHHHGDLKGKKLVLSILLNIAITLAQIIGGLVSGSLSLLSDAVHNASDVLSLIISYIASKLAQKNASVQKTFGYKRAEILAAFVNAASLVLIAIFLIIEAVERFQNPQDIASGLVILLSLIGIVANGLSVLLLKSEAHANMNMKSAYLHLLTDMLASIAVLIGGILMYYFQWFWVDSLLTLAIAIYLIIVGYDLLKSSYKILMLFTPDTIEIPKIVARLKEIKIIKTVHHVHVWQLNEMETHLEAHIDFNKDIYLSEFEEILEEIEHILETEFNINHCNIQPEFGKIDPKEIIVQD